MDNISGKGNFDRIPSSKPEGDPDSKGSLEGEKVEYHAHGDISEIAQQAADFAEEATQMKSEDEGKDVSKEEAIKRRKVLSKEDHEEMIKLKEQYMGFFKEAGFGTEELKLFLENLRNLKDQSPTNILNQAGKQFQDVTLRHAALEYTAKVLDIIGDQRDEALRLNIPKAQKILLNARDEKGHLLAPQIKAGYNITEAVTTYVGQFDREISPTELRDLYRSFIEEEQAVSLTGVFKFVHSRLKGKNFDTFLEFALQATGEDMGTGNLLGPSRDKVRLESNQNALFMIQALRTAQEFITESFSPIQKDIDTFGIMTGLFKLMGSKYPDAQEALAIAKSVGITSPEEKVRFTNELVTFTRQRLPIEKEGLWISPQHREKVIEVLLEAATIADNDLEE